MRQKHKINAELKLRIGQQVQTASGGYVCMADGCQETAIYPAPKNRDQLRHYIWFCLEHVRVYNLSWNYYDGIEGDALEQVIRHATIWERPSWKFSTGFAAEAASSQPFEDRFGLFEEGRDKHSTGPSRSMPPITLEEQNAWRLFDLPPDSEQVVLKKRYNMLAKTLHPDHNKQDRNAEEKLKEINLAYSILRKKTDKQKTSAL